MISRIIKLAVVLMLTAIAFWGCSREIADPVSPPFEGFVPPTPTNLIASIGDREVALSWSVSSTQNISSYRIYSSDSTDSAYTLHGESQSLSYTASSLQNGRIYLFRITAVSDSDFEGHRSEAIRVIPNLFSININEGQQYTSSRIVTLTITAPGSTQLMQISNDSLFSNSQWEVFSTSKEWQLTNGDGLKSVYGRFRDVDDRASQGYFSDDITLDSRAFIDSIDFQPVNPFYVAGDNIHFRLFAGEIEGSGTAAIGDFVTVPLFDDGTQGDIIAADGIYEGDFVITNNLDFENATVFGDFQDRAGNSAATAESRTSITVRKAPEPVLLSIITAPLGVYDRLQLQWTPSQAQDFANYRIYRSLSGGVDSTSQLINFIEESTTTSFFDTALTPDTRYYYKIYIVDNTGLWTGSNEVNATTNQDLAPTPVNLFPIIATPGTFDRLELSWSVSSDFDFLRYELYRSLDAAVDTSDFLAFASNSELAFIDTGLADGTTYYYSVLTVDLNGNSAFSNIRDGRTGDDLPPAPVTINPIIVQPDYYSQVTIQWSSSEDMDFSSYRLYRWDNIQGRDDSVLVALITDQLTPEYVDNPPFSSTGDTLDYWYIVHTYDRAGNSAPSEIALARLVDLIPPTVNGGISIAESSLVASWGAVSIPDFANYRLLRNTSLNPGSAIVVFVTADSSLTTYADDNTIDDQVYYYWLDVYDARNNTSRTLLGSGNW